MLLVFLLNIVAVLLPLTLIAQALAAPFATRTQPKTRGDSLYIFLLVAFSLFLWLAPWGSALGYLSARMDLLGGGYQLYSVPALPSEKTRLAFARILRDRYAIPCTWGGPCITTFSETRFHAAYDRVMLPAIQKHFGRDILEECKLAAISETAK